MRVNNIYCSNYNYVLSHMTGSQTEHIVDHMTVVTSLGGDRWLEHSLGLQSTKH